MRRWLYVVPLLLLTLACIEGAGLPASASPLAASLEFHPPSLALASGGSGTLDLRLRDAQQLAGFEVDLSFNPAFVTLVRVERLVGTPAQPSPGRTWISLPASNDPDITYITISPGNVSFGAYSYGAGAPLGGDLSLVRLHFRAVGAGTSQATLTRVLLANANAQGSSAPSTPATITTGVTTATISGRLDLQGRTNESGAVVTTGDASTTTDASGAFSLQAPTGLRRITASHPGYLSRVITPTLTSAGLMMPEAILTGGDASRDNQIDLFDLVLIASNYDAPLSPSDTRPDINGDGVVGLIDLTLVGTNYGKSGPELWLPSLSLNKGRRPSAPPTVWLDQPKAAPGQIVEVPVFAENGHAIQGADLTLRFDPAQVELLALTPGSAFDATSRHVALSEVQSKQGMARLAVTRLGAAADLPDRVTLAVATVRLTAGGTPDLRVDKLELVDSEGQSLNFNAR